MPLTIHHKARARIGSGSRAVYPLEIFGLLLGWSNGGGDDAYVAAALPVGKTKQWLRPDGRFDAAKQAAVLAGDLFRPWELWPIGLFASWECGMGEDMAGYLGTVPHIGSLPWLVVMPCFGGETILSPDAYRDTRDGWQGAELSVDRHATQQPIRNTKRIAAVWNRAWGTLDYDNGYRDELARRQGRQQGQ